MWLAEGSQRMLRTPAPLWKTKLGLLMGSRWDILVSAERWAIRRLSCPLLIEFEPRPVRAPASMVEWGGLVNAQPLPSHPQLKTQRPPPHGKLMTQINTTRLLFRPLSHDALFARLLCLFWLQWKRQNLHFSSSNESYVMISTQTVESDLFQGPTIFYLNWQEEESNDSW